jgi:type I restriction enzyme, S subunit
MDVKAGHQKTEVGVFPSDWDIEAIENFANITTGSRNTQDRVDNGKYPFFVRSQTVEHINSYSFNGEAVLTAGDGVGTGKVFHYINGRFDIHQRVYQISEFEEHIHGYYFFLQFSSRFYDRVMQMTAKSSVDSVRMEMISRMLIPLPPTKAEQEAIAEALSDADALIESLEQLIIKKRQIKQGAMQELLTGKKRLPGFSGEWKTTRLVELADIRSGGTPSTTQPQFWDGDVLWCTPTDITGLTGFKFLNNTGRTISRLGLKSSSAEIIPENSILMTSRATIGECAINQVPVTTNQGFKNFVPFQTVDVEFLYYILSTQKQNFINLCGGSTFLEIGKHQLVEFEVTIPEMKAEQTSIATVLSDMDAEITAIKVKLNKARQIKQGMMQELLTGRIRLI